MYESCGSAPFAPSSPVLKSSFHVFGSPAFAFAPLLTSQLRRPSPHADINNNTTRLFSAPLLHNTTREPGWHPQNDAQSIQLRGAPRHQQTHRKQTTTCNRCARHGDVRASARLGARAALSRGHVRCLPAQTDKYRSAIQDRFTGACRQGLCRAS
jgi:hypothetical protein